MQSCRLEVGRAASPLGRPARPDSSGRITVVARIPNKHHAVVHQIGDQLAGIVREIVEPIGQALPSFAVGPYLAEFAAKQQALMRAVGDANAQRQSVLTSDAFLFPDSDLPLLKAV